MRTLLLTSAGFENPRIGEEFLRLICKPISCVRVLFIPTAAITEEQLHFVEESRMELLAIGVENGNIVDYNLDEPITLDEAMQFDVVYVCGGSTLHLLNKIHEVHFDTVLQKLLEAGRVYVGVSAGSIVLGPWVSDRPGLHWIDHRIVPHYTDELREKVQAMQNPEYIITPLTDAQALLIRGENTIIVE